MSRNFSELQSVMDILKKVVKLPQRSKSFVFIFILTSVCYTILIIVSMDPMNPLMSSMDMDPTNPGYLKQLYIDTMVFFLCISIISFSSMVTTIYVSAVSYLERKLEFKDILKFKKMWIRPVVTWFYFTLMCAGFFLLVSPLFLLLIPTKGSIIVLAIGIVLVLLAICLYMYLALVWMLSIVISVLEDCYGLQALGKSAELLKGRKVVGLVLTFVLMILIGVNVFVTKLFNVVSAMNFAVLVKMLSMMIYTLFYFDCKQSHGEKVQVEENIEYVQVSTLPVVDL
ncbi:hypothetical protein AQUCO_00400015v1 [Aquilegia coerulea]|uniref:Uncharacterized protein n=1 Tax=Aquilegia coerulea TaxID=218851 RepID=A0A2G5ET11_AQUCA|nr:hypothetical protein AQUCO_00400015v1 [Aquilegia coerulea]